MTIATGQPDWELVAQLGDASPLDHGGYFVYRDRTGVYTEEAEFLEPDEWDGDPKSWTSHRFILDRCTLVDGVLSDNPYHPDMPAWWADSIDAVARSGCWNPDELRAAFGSDDPLVRAEAYRAVGLYHGFNNLDCWPVTFETRAEVAAHYGIE